MLRVSDLLLEHREVETFAQLLEVVKLRARSEFFLSMDLKPPYPDTPLDWEEALESAFTSRQEDSS
ncbi:MAG: sulfur relay protein DsrC [Gammaproteobacteria bacterium]|nr:sulfur relay protein DsrC [Gammaproteobacteria bacterium]